MMSMFSSMNPEAVEAMTQRCCVVILDRPSLLRDGEGGVGEEEVGDDDAVCCAGL